MYLELRIATCACMLAIASILDMKSREIPDKLWLIFGGLGAAIAAIELASLPAGADRVPFLAHYALGTALISAIGYAVYRAGLYGGADPKALVAMALILPAFDPAFKLHAFPALAAFTNALVFSLAGMLYNIVKNSISLSRGIPIFRGMQESGMRKALAFAVGFSSNSSGKFLFAMEARDESGQRRFRFNPASYDEFVQADNDGSSGGDSSGRRMWVTQALPFIVYIGAGFAALLVLGDLLAVLIALFS
jgi:preflagellin peptidase FlaK